MAEDTNIIEMQDENGNVLSFEHLLTFEVEDNFYIAFTPIGKFEDFEEGEVLIMRIEDDDDHGDVYMPIESEEELNELWEIFKQLYYEDDEDEEGEE